jgi:hypothetical protein
MCSRHPEEGAGSEYVHFDTDKVEWWHELHSLPPIVPPPWIARAVNGGWDVPKGHEDKPQEEVSNGD